STAIVGTQESNLALIAPVDWTRVERQAQCPVSAGARGLVIAAESCRQSRRNHRPGIVLIQFLSKAMMDLTHVIQFRHQTGPSETQLCAGIDGIEAHGLAG